MRLRVQKCFSTAKGFITLSSDTHSIFLDLHIQILWYDGDQNVFV